MSVGARVQGFEMTKAIVAALMAASSILPGVASAQGRQDRGDRAQTEQQREARADRRAERRQDGGRDAPAERPQRATEQRAERREARPDRQGEDRRGQRADRRDDRAGARVADRDRGRFDNNGRYDRTPQRADGGRGWQNRGPAYTQRFAAQRWSNDWRRDGRYDWNRYRSVNRNAFRLPRYYAPGGFGYGYRRFGLGVRIAAPLFGRNYWISDPYAYRLPSAYGAYRWVRYFDDALLIDLRTGSVVDAEYGIFW